MSSTLERRALSVLINEKSRAGFRAHLLTDSDIMGLQFAVATGRRKESPLPMMFVFNFANGGDLRLIQSVVDAQAFEVLLPILPCMRTSHEMSEENECNARENRQTP